MPIAYRLLTSSSLALALTLNACGGDTSDTGGQSTTTAPAACASDARAMAYAVGLSKAADDSKVKITFVDAAPAPPARGSNTFTIDVEDGGGEAIEGAMISVKPFMPDHGHAASVTPTVAPGDKPGRYVVEPIELFMPGIWEITFTVTPSGGAADPVKFTFCVAD